jgi:hypothetical protein
MEKTRKLTIVCAAACALAIGVAGVSFAGTTLMKPAEVQAAQTSTTFSATTPLFKKVAYQMGSSDTSEVLVFQHMYAAIKDDMASNSYDYVDSSNKTHTIVATLANAYDSEMVKTTMAINPAGGLFSATGVGGCPVAFALIGLKNVRSVTVSMACSSGGPEPDSTCGAYFFSSGLASTIYQTGSLENSYTYTVSCDSGTYPTEPRWLGLSIGSYELSGTVTLTSLSLTWDQSC